VPVNQGVSKIPIDATRLKACRENTTGKPNCMAPAFGVIGLRLSDASEGSGRIPEIKRDSFRTLLRDDRATVRAFTRGGHGWTDKYSGVVEACGKLRCKSALIDGEIIVQDKNGLSDFGALRAATEGASHRLVMFAFDLL
jgi:bifunctional non-homologous end joining protein LigD